jgi:hypothetical protein
MSVGMARRNENSVAVLLFIPRRTPEAMVAPDLETPGIKATACAAPTQEAWDGRTRSGLVQVMVGERRAIHKKTSPPKISERATVTELYK